jgi:hypothetical protein
MRSQQAAEFTGISVDTLKHASKAGDLPCIRLGFGPKGKETRVWRTTDLIAWIDGMVTVMTPVAVADRGRPARALSRGTRPERRTGVLSARDALRQSAAA